MSKRKYWLFRELRQLDRLNTALMYYQNLPRNYQMRITRCKLNLKPALARCEKLYGKGNCEKITPTMTHKKCPKGTSRVGCCTCAKSCPSNFYKPKGFYCLRDRTYELDHFSTIEECELQNHGHCHLLSKEEDFSHVGLEHHFVADCTKGFTREGGICRINCPKGYDVIKGKCARKRIMSLGTPFLWIQSDM
jgi:hypothetical protein